MSEMYGIIDDGDIISVLNTCNMMCEDAAKHNSQHDLKWLLIPGGNRIDEPLLKEQYKMSKA